MGVASGADAELHVTAAHLRRRVLPGFLPSCFSIWVILTFFSSKIFREFFGLVWISFWFHRGLVFHEFIFYFNGFAWFELLLKVLADLKYEKYPGYIDFFFSDIFREFFGLVWISFWFHRGLVFHEFIFYFNGFAWFELFLKVLADLKYEPNSYGGSD